jgi:ATP-dependent Clp protease protease subunit
MLIVMSGLAQESLSLASRPCSLLLARARRERDPVIAPVIQLGEDDFTDLQTHMMRNRIIFLGERINDQVAVKVVASLIALNTLSTDEEIKFYINSAAGSSYAVVSILDTLRAIKAPVSTVAFGMVGGNVVQILAAGTKGKRFSMPSTRIMLQQPNGGAQGSADEVNIQTTELNRTMRMMYRFLSENTGLDVERIEEECDRENFLSPEEAVELGIIDDIIS